MDVKIKELEKMTNYSKVYLDEYYSKLQNTIIKEFSNKRYQIKENELHFYKRMIDKIQAFKTTNLDLLDSNTIFEVRKKEINAKLEETKKKIKRKHIINDTFLDVEINEIKKSLFFDKTIYIFKYSFLQDKEKVVKCIEDDDENNIFMLISDKQYLDETLFNPIESTYNIRTLKSELRRESIAFNFLYNNRCSNSRMIDFDHELSLLKTLDCAAKSITSIQIDTLRNLNNLLILDLSSNNLVRLDDYVFKDLAKLKHLWLNRNNIRSVGKNAFGSLLKLEWLDLSNNEIRSFEVDTFKDLLSLEILDLEGNKIESLELRMFEKNIKLKNLFMNNNPFVFDYSKSISNENFWHFNDVSHIFGRNILNAENELKYWVETNDLMYLDYKSNRKSIIDLIKTSISKLYEPSMIKKTESNDKMSKIALEEFQDCEAIEQVNCKYQVIDLNQISLNEAFLEEYKPKIEIGVQFNSKPQCDSSYCLNVYLISESFQLLHKYLYESTFKQSPYIIMQFVSHTFEFKRQFRSLRYILFSYGEKGVLIFPNNFIKTSNSYVKFIGNNSYGF